MSQVQNAIGICYIGHYNWYTVVHDGQKITDGVLNDKEKNK